MSGDIGVLDRVVLRDMTVFRPDSLAESILSSIERSFFRMEYLRDALTPGGEHFSSSSSELSFSSPTSAIDSRAVSILDCFFSATSIFAYDKVPCKVPSMVSRARDSVLEMLVFALVKRDDLSEDSAEPLLELQCNEFC
jgi:hypothetical protein